MGHEYVSYGACLLGGDGEPTREWSHQRISYTEAQEIVGCITKDAIQRLVLRGCELEESAATRVGRALLTNSGGRVSRLDVSGTPLNTPSLRALAQALRQNMTVTAVSFVGCGFEDTEEQLAMLAGSTMVLQHLLAARNVVGLEAAQHLGRVLKLNTTLLTLDLSQCALGTDGAAAVLMGIAQHRHLTALSLVENGIDHRAVPAIKEAVEGCGTLLTLNLSKNSIGTVSWLCGHSLRTSLCELSLSACGLDGSQVAGLCKVVTSLPSLRALDISRNPLGDATSLLLDLLPATSIRYLNGAHTGMSAACGAAVGRLVEESTVLVALNVSGTEAADLEVLADIFTRNRDLSLRSLSVGGRRLSDESIKRFAHSIRETRNIQALVLNAVGMLTDAFICLCDALSGEHSTTNLVQFDVEENPISDTPLAVDAIRRVFSRNPSLGRIRAADTLLVPHGVKEVARGQMCPDLPPAVREEYSAFDPTTKYSPSAMFFGCYGIEESCTRKQRLETRIAVRNAYRGRIDAILTPNDPSISLPVEHTQKKIPKYVVPASVLGGDEEVVVEALDDKQRSKAMGEQVARKLLGVGHLSEKGIRRTFEKIDRNGDGQITLKEFQDYLEGALLEVDADAIAKINATLKEKAKKTLSDDASVTFDEFALVFLKIAESLK